MLNDDIFSLDVEVFHVSVIEHIVMRHMLRSHRGNKYSLLLHSIKFEIVRNLILNEKIYFVWVYLFAIYVHYSSTEEALSSSNYFAVYLLGLVTFNQQ